MSKANTIRAVIVVGALATGGAVAGIAGAAAAPSGSSTATGTTQTQSTPSTTTTPSTPSKTTPAPNTTTPSGHHCPHMGSGVEARDPNRGRAPAATPADPRGRLLPTSSTRRGSRLAWASNREAAGRRPAGTARRALGDRKHRRRSALERAGGTSAALQPPVAQWWRGIPGLGARDIGPVSLRRGGGGSPSVR